MRDGDAFPNAGCGFFFAFEDALFVGFYVGDCAAFRDEGDRFLDDVFFGRSGHFDVDRRFG